MIMGLQKQIMHDQIIIMYDRPSMIIMHDYISVPSMNTALRTLRIQKR
jgi:hypothetical protein